MNTVVNSIKPLSIGPIALDAPMAQAALSGYSDVAMRRLAREYGCPYTLNEVVLDRLVGQRGKRMRRMLTIDPGEHPVGGQLMGSEPDQFAAAADDMVRQGYDAVDINFGCPVKKVLGRCRGGFLLSDPPMAKSIVQAVFGAVAGRVPVTLKMRRGLDETAGSERNFFEILDAAFTIGCAAITVHGRTVKQRYVGPSQWEFLSRVKRHAGDRTIIGSGDLFTALDCVRMLEETGIDGVSIARGAIGNPFIFREVRALLAGRPLPGPPTIEEQRRAIERHVELLAGIHGDEGSVLQFRKFGVRYSELHPLNREVKSAFLRVKTPDDFRAMLDEWFNDPNRYPAVERRARPEALIAAGASWDCEEN